MNKYHPVMSHILNGSGLNIDQFKNQSGLSYGTAHSIMVNGIYGRSYYTIDKVAKVFGLKHWQLVKLFEEYLAE